MNKDKILTEAKASIVSKGRQKVAFALPKKYYQEVQQISKDLSHDVSIVHTALLKYGLNIVSEIKQEDVFKYCVKFRQEKETEPRAPSSFGISFEAHQGIKDFAIEYSLKNVEAHYVALTIGLEKFKKLK